MRKLFLMLFLMTLSVMGYSQEVDTLDYFYLNKSHMRFQDRYESSLSEESKKKSQEYYDWLKEEVKTYYQFWDGSNEPIMMVSTKNEFTTKEWTSLFSTDYFEVHFAKRYMDSTYLTKTITEGEELFDDFMFKNESSREDDYIKVLKKAKAMLSTEDFFLMFAFADKLKRAICFVRINGAKNKFYILLTQNNRVSGTDYLDRTYKQLTSGEIPENYIIQTKFELR